MTFRCALVAAAFVLAGCEPVPLDAPASDSEPSRAIVGRATVIDGDTFEIRGQRIRLWGVDAPESSQRCYRSDRGPWRCGTAAANALSEWLDARNLTCVRKGRSYDRVVARCSVDGDDVGAWMVRNGWALEYRQFSRGAYRADEERAVRERRNVHSGDMQAPWAYRQERRGRPAQRTPHSTSSAQDRDPRDDRREQTR